MEETIFTKIIHGDIPCHKIYEDEHTFAFLDIHPVQPGMVLVVSKLQVASFTDLPEDEFRALMGTVRKVARRLQDVFPKKKRIGVQIEGLDVPHVHVKVFPIDSGAEFRAEPDMSVVPDRLALEAMAEQLAFK